MPRQPTISIYASAYRPQNWMALYDSIGPNDADFEMVFVGPNPPAYELPPNFRFIQSFVKPTQCLEIAFRNTTGEFVMNMPDDCEFGTERPLDRLLETYRACNTDKVIVSLRFRLDGLDQVGAQHFVGDDPATPVMPVCGFMSRRAYAELGGIDRNFIAVMWDLDVAMRMYAQGGSVVLSDVYINEDKGKSQGSDLCGEYWRHDRTLLESLWMRDGAVTLQRADPLEPFSDEGIVDASQGPRGRWRGDGPLLLRKLEDRFGTSLSLMGRLKRAVASPSLYRHHLRKLVLRFKGHSL